MTDGHARLLHSYTEVDEDYLREVEALEDAIGDELIALVVPPTAPRQHRATEGVERLALSKDEAAQALGVSVDTLERRIMPDLKTVRLGSRVLVPRKELDRWLDANAARALKDDG